MTGQIQPYYKEHEILTDIRNLYVNVETLSLEYYKVKIMQNDPLWVNLTDIFQGNIRYRDVIDELEKIDISEEIDRINSHLNQIFQSIKSKQLSGKKINFILQEINRESNTILSKFLDKRISKHAISLKMQAEKLREQIGNIL